MAFLNYRSLILITFFLLISGTKIASATRLKDLADVEGVRGNQLYGFGLVIGLNGTGDSQQVDFNNKALSNLLEKAGIRSDSRLIRVRNVASVMVTATLPAFTRPGSRIDVTISSMGDAKSLLGGVLLFTPLRGADGNIYGIGQGAIVVGGFSVGSGGDSTQKNHPTVGTITNGAVVERAIPFDLFQSHRIRVVLKQPDFTTMTRVVKRINNHFGRPLAVAIDSASLEVAIADDLAKDPVQLLATVEQLDVIQDVDAKVVVNERTGTIIMGENVTISTVALAHGNLSIAIRSENQVSQPAPFAEGTTETVTNTDVEVAEDVQALSLIKGRVTLGEVVKALNSLGATPRDLISIFQAMKRAGALNAELVVM
jgi:flagellar P-ring protein precursor FlgI